MPPPPMPDKPKPSRTLSIPKVVKPPFRFLFYAIEGFGKTTMATYAPKPAILMAPRERGYLTLLGYNRVQQIPSTVVSDFDDSIAWIDSIADNPGDRQTIVTDALSGFEQMCVEHTINNFYGGDFEKYDAYGKGIVKMRLEFRRLLGALDRAQAKGLNILVLAHAGTKKFKNPLGADYDRYSALADEGVYQLVRAWSDAVLFGMFETATLVSKNQQDKSIAEQKGKAVGGRVRLVHAEAAAGYDAKNQYGLPPVIEIPNDHEEGWQGLWSMIRGEA